MLCLSLAGCGDGANAGADGDWRLVTSVATEDVDGPPELSLPGDRGPALASVGHTLIQIETNDTIATGSELPHPIVARRGRGADRHAGHRQRDASGRRTSITATPNGGAIVAWSSTAAAAGGGTRYPVRVAAASPDGTFGQPRTLAQTGAVNGVASDPAGRAAVIWATTDEQLEELTDPEGARDARGLFASVRAADGQPFGDAERLPLEPAASPAEQPRPAFDWQGRPTLPAIDRSGSSTSPTLRLVRRAAP